ncbi:MAG: CRISPR-associated endonuclease Cas1 [archaeon]
MIEERLRNLVISGLGCELRKEGELLKVISKENEQQMFYIVSPRNLEQVILTGECLITTGALRLLLENNVDVVFVEHVAPKFFARMVRNDNQRITELWKKQLLLSFEKKMEIAKEIEECGIYNKIRLLKMLEKNRDLKLKEEIECLQLSMGRIKQSSSIAQIMGVEGEATETYFAALRKVIPFEFGFVRRERHPPRDPINSLLGYGYTILASRVEYAVLRAGLNPYEGIIHSSYDNRTALCFDLIEEFRQVIVDRVILTMIVQHQISVEDFELTPAMCMIKEKKRKEFLNALYTRMEAKHKYEEMELSYLDIIFAQAKKLAKAIGENEKYRGFRWV